MPIDNLPTELLLMIFKLSCFTNNINHTLTTIRLSHVSRTWRRLSLSSPSLWANITYQSPIGYHRNYIALQKLMTYLARSNPHPITLHLYISNIPDEGFQIICEHSIRWKHLSLRCNHSIVRYLSVRLRKLPVPNLESLQATSIPAGRDPEETSGPPPPPPINSNQPSWNIFTGGTPKLTYLDLWNSSVYYMRPIHIETLTTIHFHSSFNDLELTPIELHSILTIPNLITITLLTEFWELIPDISHIWPERIIMSKLRYLGISGQYGSDFEVMRILGTISCPNLLTLLLQNVVGTCLDDSPTDIDSRSPEILPNLQILHLLDNCEISPSLHPHLIQTCITIKEIIFDTGVSESAAIGSLLLPFDEEGGIPTKPPIVFPELTTLVIRSIDKRDAQNLITILPGLEEQGRKIEKIVLGPEIADVWIASGHADGIKQMKSEVWREEEGDVNDRMWITPKRTLVFSNPD